MRNVVCLICTLLLCLATQLFAQETGFNQLLNAHDYLFFNRIKGNYSDSGKRIALLRHAERSANNIKDISLLKENFGLLYNKYYAEYYYLKTLVYLDQNKDKPYEKLLLAIDTTLAWYRNNIEIGVDSAELNTIKRIAGVRSEPVITFNNEPYNSLVDLYNTIVLNIFYHEANIYNEHLPYDFARIENIYSRYKFYNSEKKENDFSSDTISLAILRSYTFFKLLEAGKKGNCDSIMYYLAFYTVLEEITDSYIPDNLPAIRNTGYNCVYDPISRENFEDSLYEVFSARPRGEIPPMPAFPWPPPQPSARSQPLNFKSKKINTLDDANQQLVSALSQAKYDQYDYYYLPGGFALVTPLEQLQADATPKGDPPRWNIKVELSDNFSFVNYLKALFFGERGYYRIMAFIVTDKSFSLDQSASISQIQNLKGGLIGLPPEIGLQPYTANHKCTVLIYEFEKQKSDQVANFIKPGRYNVQTHLKKTLIWQNLF